MNRNYPNINRRSLTCILPVFCLLLMCFICLQARAEEVEEEKIPSGLGQACLSEIMTKNKATLRDPDGDFSDWIEIRNTAGRAINLEGWSLSKNGGKSVWSFPSFPLDENGYAIVYAAKKERAGTVLCTGFALSDGDTLTLCDRTGAMVSFCSIGTDKSDWSIASDDSGTWSWTPWPTPGLENSPEGYERFASSVTCVGPLMINEVCVDNFTSFYDETIGYSDWVEVKNISGETLDLSRFCLSDDNNNLKKGTLEGFLSPGERKVFLCDKNGPNLASGLTTLPFSLNAESEQLYLSTAEGEIIDYAALREIPYKATYGRENGRSGYLYFAQGSPGFDNENGKRRVSALPASPSRIGTYDNTSSLSVSLSGNGKIRYTLDGSLPTAASPLYEAPILISQTTVVRAVSIEDDALPSHALTLPFFLNEGHSLPVVSLTADYPDSFRDMYTNGVKGMELPGALVYCDGEKSFSIGCGIKMHGDTSLVLPKKNMSMRFRGSYGRERLEYDLFGGGVTSFSNLLLRAGQDQSNTIVRNEACYALTSEFSNAVPTERFQYCVVYLNGVYNGIYALMEKPNEDFYGTRLRIDKDDVEMEEASVFHGSLYTDVFSHIYDNSMGKEGFYQVAAQFLDMDSLIDWCILEGCFGNYDLGEGNLRYARNAANGGKWQLVLYDLDCAFLSPEFCMHNVLTYGNQVSTLNAKLMQSAEYRERFLSRAAEAWKDILSRENICRKIDELSAIVAPEVERDSALSGINEMQWREHLSQLKNKLSNGWTKNCVDTLCNICQVTPEEYLRYFGDLQDLK